MQVHEINDMQQLPPNQCGQQANRDGGSQCLTYNWMIIYNLYFILQYISFALSLEIVHWGLLNVAAFLHKCSAEFTDVHRNRETLTSPTVQNVSVVPEEQRLENRDVSSCRKLCVQPNNKCSGSWGRPSVVMLKTNVMLTDKWCDII